MDMFQEMLEKKKAKKMDPVEKEAKMGVLKEIRDMASGEMGEEVKGIKKVTVAAPDQEGLEQGLDKAKELVDSEEPCGECGKEPCECSHKEALPAGINRSPASLKEQAGIDPERDEESLSGAEIELLQKLLAKAKML